MNILIDIGHPAHVHYFKIFIRHMQREGHEFMVIARNKDVTFSLLDEYNIPYIDRGYGGKGVIGKIIYMLQADWFVYKLAKAFKPDLLISFSTIYPAHVSFFTKRSCIIITDTEHSKEQQLLFLPFCEVIITPEAFNKSFGKKQLRVKSFTELFYLHPNYFKADESILKQIDIKPEQKYVIIRFVAWEASHDFGHRGLNLKDKRRLILELSKVAKVFIISEAKLPDDLMPYVLNVKPSSVHDVLAYASLFVGESGTMSSECSMLGIPNIQIRHIIDENNIPGVHVELAKRGMKKIMKSDDIDNIIKVAIELINNNKVVKEIMYKSLNKFLNEHVDFTDYLICYAKNFAYKRKEG